MRVNLNDLVNKRVQYRKPGGRQGWTGTIEKAWIDHSMPGGVAVLIQYDNGVNQQYCIEAIQGYAEPIMYQYAAGYIHITGDAPAPGVDTTTHFVKGCQSDRVIPARNEEAAHGMAANMAADSKKNEAFQVMKLVCKYVKEEQPVKRVDY